MKIEYLADHPKFLSEVAEMVFLEWRELCAINGVSFERIMEILRERSMKDRIPCALIVLQDEKPVATGSIKMAEPTTHEGVSPWLDMMFVKKEYRGSGLGRFLLNALEKRAWQLGARALYLSTDEAEEFYRKNGWTLIQHQMSVDNKNVAFMTKKRA